MIARPEPNLSATGLSARLKGTAGQIDLHMIRNVEIQVVLKRMLTIPY